MTKKEKLLTVLAQIKMNKRTDKIIYRMFPYAFTEIEFDCYFSAMDKFQKENNLKTISETANFINEIHKNSNYKLKEPEILKPYLPIKIFNSIMEKYGKSDNEIGLIEFEALSLYNKNCEIAKEFENFTDTELDNRIKELENILNTDTENR
jgi:hypothetical protein